MGCIRPNSMAIRPKRMPFAARVNATGKPSSRNSTSVANMMGARLPTMNSISAIPFLVSRIGIVLARQTCGLFRQRLLTDLFGKFFFGRTLFKARKGIGPLSSEDSTRFDQLGGGRHEQQREAQRHQKLYRPAYQGACVR